jgi:hypothetical protein
MIERTRVERTMRAGTTTTGAVTSGKAMGPTVWAIEA